MLIISCCHHAGACNEALCQATGLCEWASTCLADGKCEVEYRPPGSNCSSGLGTCSEDHTCMIGEVVDFDLHQQ